MDQTQAVFVVDTSGQRGRIESMPDEGAGDNAPVAVRLENGQKLLLPLNVLTRRADGSYFLPFTLSEFVTAVSGSHSTPAYMQSSTSGFQSAAASAATASVAIGQNANVVGNEHQTRAASEELVIPVAAEQVAVGKRVVQTGGVRIIKTIVERQETVDVPLIEDHVEVERVAVNRVLDVAPEVRRDGETLIVPILEEVIVVEKRLMLKEELHIRMRREEAHHPQEVTLRRENVEVERFTTPDAEQAISSARG